jgi:hypothetical protein
MSKTVRFSETPVLVRQISDQSEARKENTQTPTEHILAKKEYRKEKNYENQLKLRQSQSKITKLPVKSIKLDARAEAREAMRVEELNKLNSKDSGCMPGESCSIMGGKKTKRRTRRIRRTKRTRMTRKTKRTKRT